MIVILRNLMNPTESTIEILRLLPQNDITTKSSKEAEMRHPPLIYKRGASRVDKHPMSWEPVL